MAWMEPVGSIVRPYNSVSRDAEGPEFIQCVDVREPQIHEVWDFGDNGVTHEVHPTVQVDVVSGVVREVASN